MAANESTRERIEKMSIILDHVNYVYGADTPLAVHALNDVCLKIPDGQFIGIIGHTGSGKSTLMQHMNGLIRATDGHIYFNGEDIYDKDYDMKKLRSKVGLVFQYPEHQLFEIDVFSDVCFGPKNLGLDKKEVELRAYDALKKVGLPDELFYQSPFELSGGQKRRVAIARRAGHEAGGTDPGRADSRTGSPREEMRSCSRSKNCRQRPDLPSCWYPTAWKMWRNMWTVSL